MLVRMTPMRLLRRLMSRWLNPDWRMQTRGKWLRPWWTWRFAEFGSSSVLTRPAWIAGARRIAIGSEVVIFPGSWLASESADASLQIGDGCLIRSSAVLSASERVVLEDYVVLAGRVTVIDSDHTWSDGEPRITNNRSLTGPIRIGRGTWVAEQSMVLRNTDIGAFCIVAANSVVRGTFPDFSLIAGSPAVVIGSTAGRVPESLRGSIEPKSF